MGIEHPKHQSRVENGEEIMVGTFDDYFKESSVLVGNIKNTHSEATWGDGVRQKFFNELQNISIEISDAVAQDVLSGDDLALYTEYREKSLNRGSIEQPDRYEAGRQIVLRLRSIVEHMQVTGQIVDEFKDKIHNIPEPLKKTFTDAVRHGRNYISELKLAAQEYIEDRLNPLNLEDELMKRTPLIVKIKRSSGEMEDGWVVVSTKFSQKGDGSDMATGKVITVCKNSLSTGKFSYKRIAIDDLKQWNMPAF